MSQNVIREACVETFEEVIAAIAKGADRIEFNDNIISWGTTPSLGNIFNAVEYCHKKEIPIIIMNRPRGGNFRYSEIEKDIMRQDLEVIIKSGADGVALGALNENDELDKDFLDEMIRNIKQNGLEVTFHRAFDFIPFDLQIESLVWLADRGVDRIATNGGTKESNIFDNINRLKELVDADRRIAIMAGGGITTDNYNKLIELTGIVEVHGTQII